VAISDVLKKAASEEIKENEKVEESKDKFSPLEEIIAPIRDAVNEGKLDIEAASLRIINELSQFIEGKRREENEKRLKSLEVEPTKVERFNQILKEVKEA